MITLIDALLPIAGLVALCVFDRAVLRRGKVSIDSVERWEDDGTQVRLSIRYHVKARPFWSEVRYSLVDRENPTTVISGKTRSLDFSRIGENEEFYYLKKDLLRAGYWDLRVKVVSTAGRLNPLYSLMPMQQYYTIPIEVKE